MRTLRHAVMLLALLGCVAAPAAPDAGRTALLLPIDGAIGPATADQVERGIARAAEQHAELVVLGIDTPGGLDSAMRTIVKAILDSPVPVVGYVSPGGARAASAGTYILYACQVAAMAPATNLGAATPISIGGVPSLPSGDEGEKEKKPEPPASASERKLVNDAAAYIRSLAERYGRNADWAEQAVREGASLTAKAALDRQVIDLIATDLGDLFEQLDGRTLTASGIERTLHTGGLAVERVEPDWRTRLLSVITDPNVAYVLLLLGIYGLIFELSNPGSVLPGVIGTICLLLALYAFQILPINYAGLALIAVGIAFMISEAFVPSFGILGLGGVAAFVAGSIILLGTENLTVSIPLIAGTALVSAGFFIWVIGRFVRLRRQRVRTGGEELPGSPGTALEAFDGAGRVHVHGEDWRAVTAAPVRKGQRVRVLAVDGLTLKVKPVEEDD